MLRLLYNCSFKLHVYAEFNSGGCLKILLAERLLMIDWYLTLNLAVFQPSWSMNKFYKLRVRIIVFDAIFNNISRPQILSFQSDLN